MATYADLNRIRYEQRSILDAATAIAKRDAIISTAKVVEHILLDAHIIANVRAATSDTAIVTFSSRVDARAFSLWLHTNTKHWIVDPTNTDLRYYVSRLATGYDQYR
jgi:hypothetical protein